MRRIGILALSLVTLAGLLSTVMAKPITEGPNRILPLAHDPVPLTPNTSVRADTFWMFAVSGPGAWGQVGTTSRGYNFEGGGGRDDEGCERAGWSGVDKTAQGATTRFHLESTLICAGTDTDMSAAGQP